MTARFPALALVCLALILWLGRADAITLPNELSFPDFARLDVYDPLRNIKYSHKYSGGTIKVEFAKQKNKLEIPRVTLIIPSVTRISYFGNESTKIITPMVISVSMKRHPANNARFAEWTGSFEDPSDPGDPFLPRWARLQYSADGYPVKGKLYNYQIELGAGRDQFGIPVPFGSAAFNFDPSTLGCERVLDLMDQLYSPGGLIFDQVSGAGQRLAELNADVSRAKNRIEYLKENFPPPFEQAYALEKSPFDEGMVAIRPIETVEFEQLLAKALDLTSSLKNVRRLREILSVGMWQPNEDALPLAEEAKKLLDLSERAVEHLLDDEIPGEITVVEGISPSKLDFADIAISGSIDGLGAFELGLKIGNAIDTAVDSITIKEAVKIISDYEKFRSGVQVTLNRDEQLLRNHERQRDKLLDRMSRWIGNWESLLLADEEIARCWRATGRADTESVGSYLQRQSTSMRIELLTK